MSRFAELEKGTNKVLRVIRAENIFWCQYTYGGLWAETHKKTPNKNYASVGWTYHPDKENFSAPQPYPSWTLDDNCNWQPPVAHPEGEGSYTWNEETQSWEELNILS